jgi:hypothetical protein
MDVLAHEPAWNALRRGSEELIERLTDLRSPLERRFRDLSAVAARVERAALDLTKALVAYRNRAFPDPVHWQVGRERHPQPEPTRLRAVREWVWSLGVEAHVPLNRQKRLSSALTEILVARAALLAYSANLHDPAPAPLVHTLNALWLLVAGCWKLRPLLGIGGRPKHD